MTNRQAHEQAAGIDRATKYGNLNAPQPNPVNPKGPEIFSLVIADLRERDTLGRKNYGGDLHAIDGRDHLVDAYQESLDQSIYLRQEIEERIILRAEIERLKGILSNIAGLYGCPEAEEFYRDSH